MTDDEYSELAECLEDACRAAEAMGVPVVPFACAPPGSVPCCPFGALVHPYHPRGRNPRPDAPIVLATGLPRDVAAAFMYGFDGYTRMQHMDMRAYALGQQFRARAGVAL